MPCRQIQPPFPLDAHAFRREAGAQLQPLQAFQTVELVDIDPVFKRRRRKSIHVESPGFMERAGRLGPAERRILKDYAGDTPDTRTAVLERLESYRLENNNQPPILSLDSQGPAGSSKQRWKCMICSGSRIFSTFQKIALHLTSNHWCLHSWRCQSCSHAYQALDQLRRHKKKHHPDALIRTEAVPAPKSASSPQRRTLDSVSSEYQSFIGPLDATPQVVAASRSDGVGHGVGWNHEEWPASHPLPRHNIPRPPTMNVVVNSHYQPNTEPFNTNTQAAVALRSDHVAHGVGWNHQEWPNPHPHPRPVISQPQVLSMLDQPPPPLPPPILKQSVGNGTLKLCHPGTSNSMNLFSPNVTTTGPRFQSTEGTRRIPTHAIDYFVDQHLSTRDTNRDVAGLSFDGPDLSQLVSGPSFPSNSFDRSKSHAVPPKYSIPENEMHRQMPRAFPSPRQLRSEEYVGSNEEMASSIFWSSDQGQRWPQCSSSTSPRLAGSHNGGKPELM